MSTKTNHNIVPFRTAEEWRLAGTMNSADALERLGNDQDLFRDIAQIYLEDCPEILQAIRTAIAEADVRALQRSAHRLKGLAATLSASDTINGVWRLEQMGASGILTESQAALEQLEACVVDLDAAVHAYLERANQHDR